MALDGSGSRHDGGRTFAGDGGGETAGGCNVREDARRLGILTLHFASAVFGLPCNLGVMNGPAAARGGMHRGTEDLR